MFEDVLYDYQYAVSEESYFEVSEEGVLLGFSEKGYAKKPVNIVIPEQINGTKITSIGQYAFDTSSEDAPSNIDFILESVVIPPSVTRIELEAFSNNSLKELILPTNLEYIGRHAFDNSKLTKLVIPNKVKRIEFQAFYGNPITELTLGSSLEFVGSMTFFNNRLKTLTLPKSLQVIDTLAFKGLPIPTISIPTEYLDWKSARTISDTAFIEGTVFKVLKE